MSSHDKRYDKAAPPWKSHRSESSSRDSPERYRKRNPDSPSRHYHASFKDRRYNENRSWIYNQSPKRHSYDYSRYKYERRPETSDDKKQHEDEKTEAPTNERDPRNFTSKNAWSSSRSPAVSKPTKPSWIMPAPEINHAPFRAESSEPTNFSLIFQHINAVCNQNDQAQLDRRMSLIDRIIADEAMRMLSAASSNEATALNEPCDTTDSIPSSAASTEETETSKQDGGKVLIGTKIADKVGTVSAADSALLQKSAEQVTKKLINQLSTMSKQDLKQMIDNPAGKYETALNRHAQNKLRAEVRKQLKGFGLGKLGSSYINGDGTVESDEAIDADKIPSALLEQIGQVLDLSFFDLAQTESVEQQPDSGEHSLPNSNEPQSKGERCEVICTPPSHESTEGTVQQKQNVSESPGKKPTKKTNVLKILPLTSGRVKKIIIRKPNVPIRNNDDPAAPALQTKGTKPLPKNNAPALIPKNLGQINIKRVTSSGSVNKPVVVTPFHVPPNRHVTSKIMERKVTSLDNVNPMPEDANSGTKNVSLLRVSTVEELNRRLSTKSVEPSNIPSHEDSSHVSGQSAVQTDIVPSSTSEMTGANGANHHLLGLGAESTAANVILWQNAPSHNKGDRPSQRPALSTVQQQAQKNSSIVERHDSRFGFGSSPSSMKQTEPSSNQMDAFEKLKNGSAALQNWMNKRNGKRVRFSMEQTAAPAAAITNVGQAPGVSDDQSMTQTDRSTLPIVRIPAQPAIKNRNSPKKRKIFQKNVCPPSTVVSSIPLNDTMENIPTQVQNGKPGVETNGETNDQPDNSSPTSKLARKKKKHKVSRFGPPINNEVPSTTTTERMEGTNGEDRILNNAYDQYLGKSVTDLAPKTMDQEPRRITIANVCSIAEEVSTSVSEVTGNKSPNVPQEISITEPKQETTISDPPEQSVPSLTTLDRSDRNITDWNLTTEPAVESKEEIPTPQPDTGGTSEEYILGGDSGEKNILGQTLPDESGVPQETATPSATPLSMEYAARLQSLCGVTEYMQSLEAQTTELYNRKMQIDALFMQLHAERMEIDQQLERLHNIRSEQINFMRHNLLELASSNSSSESVMQVPSASSVASDSGATSNGVPGNSAVQGEQISPQTGAGGRQQERTIRRITPIGNNVLMKILQRRRAPSERSTEEIPPMVDLA